MIRLVIVQRLNARDPVLPRLSGAGLYHHGNTAMLDYFAQGRYVPRHQRATARQHDDHTISRHGRCDFISSLIFADGLGVAHVDERPMLLRHHVL
jgi:hypothetical protein